MRFVCFFPIFLAFAYVTLSAPVAETTETSLAQRDPQGLTSILAGILPGTAGPPPEARDNIPIARSPQALTTTILDALLPSGDETPTGTTIPTPTPNTNTRVARNPQDISKVLGIVFPSSPSSSDIDKDSSDSLGRRAPQLDKITGIVTSLINPSTGTQSDQNQGRRWVVDTGVTAHGEANTDSNMIPRQLDRLGGGGEEHRHHFVHVNAGQDIPHVVHDNVFFEGGVPGRSPTTAAANVGLGHGDLHVFATSE